MTWKALAKLVFKEVIFLFSFLPIYIISLPVLFSYLKYIYIYIYVYIYINIYIYIYIYKTTKDLKFVSTNILASFLRPFSNFENGLEKETRVLVETNFISFAFSLLLFYHSKMLLLAILFPIIRLYIIFTIQQLSLAIQSHWNLNHQGQTQH